MNPLPKAKELWDTPQPLIDMWQASPDKIEQERLVAKIVGEAGHVADIGCGVGRYARVLNYDYYYGFDQSSEMITYAVKSFEPEIFSDYAVVQFSCVDIFNFQPETVYDTLIMIDVAYHQEQPVEAVLRILDLWKAKRYFFTLLVGPEQTLYNSQVIPDWKFDLIPIKKVHYELIDENPFNWVLFEV